MKRIPFQEKVYQVTKGIPKGKVTTYKEIARKAGFPRAFRAVGNILNKNRNSSVPCHRIIRSDGKISGYNKGAKEKIHLLKKEGIKINSHGKVTPRLN